jgi:hypothetical protein
MYKVTIQARPVKEGDWKVVASGIWTPGEQPQLGDEILPAEVLETLFNVIPSATDKSGRNEVQCGDMLYAVVLKTLYALVLFWAILNLCDLYTSFGRQPLPS